MADEAWETMAAKAVRRAWLKGRPNEPGRPFLFFVAFKRLANHAVVLGAGAVRCLNRLYWTIWLNRSAGRACGWPVRFMEKHRMLRVMTLPAIMATAAVLVACGGAVATPVPGTSAPPPPALARPTIPLAPWPLQSQLEGDGLDVTGPYEMVPGVITVFVLYEGDGPFSLIFVDEDQGEMRSIESRPGPYNGERVNSVFDGDVGGLVPGPHIGRRGYRPLAHAAVPGEGRQRSTARDHLGGQRRWRRQLAATWRR